MLIHIYYITEISLTVFDAWSKKGNSKLRIILNCRRLCPFIPQYLSMMDTNNKVKLGSGNVDRTTAVRYQVDYTPYSYVSTRTGLDLRDTTMNCQKTKSVLVLSTFTFFNKHVSSAFERRLGKLGGDTVSHNNFL